MKWFRVVYWLGSSRADWLVDAKDEFGAMLVFEAEKGDTSKIISIEQVK